MMRRDRMSKWMRIGWALVVGLFSGAALASSWSTDVSDIWWNKNESGWGINFVQTGSFVFATMYVYDPSGKATWFTGELEGSDDTAGIKFSGPLYLVTGPYFGTTPFKPELVNATKAGTMSFLFETTNSGTLTYSVNGVNVTKSIERQPLTTDSYAGEFLATITYKRSGCTNPADNQTATITKPLTVTYEGSNANVVFALSASNTCTVTGSYGQAGRVGQIWGPYSCTNGETGSTQFFQMTRDVYMFMAYLDMWNSSKGCTTQGELVAIVPR